MTPFIMDTEQDSLAMRLRISRVVAGLDQAVIAKRIGVARATVSSWEVGKSEPSASHFVRWAEATHQPLEWFAEGVKYTPRDSNPEPTDLELHVEGSSCECRDTNRHGRGACDLGCGCGWCAPELYDIVRRSELGLAA